MYRVIAFDMDGTLLNSRVEISPENEQALRIAAEAGLQPALCTGRSLPEIRRYLPQLSAVRYAVLCAGALIRDLREDRYASCRFLPEAAARAAFQALRNEDCFLEMHTPGESVVDTLRLSRLDRYGLEDWRWFFDENAVPMLAEQHAAWFEKNCRNIVKIDFTFPTPEGRTGALRQLEGQALRIVECGTVRAEVTAEGVDKASGLADLCGLLGVETAQAVMVGDSENDVPALRAAGLGIVTGNASPGAREAAALITADCDHHGAAQAVYTCLNPGC